MIALTNTWQSLNCRWCVMHSVYDIGDVDWVSSSDSPASIPGAKDASGRPLPGAGPWIVQTNTNVPAYPAGDFRAMPALGAQGC